MGPASGWISGVADLELALPRYSKDHAYIVHNAYMPLPNFVTEINFDAIILNSSFINILHTTAGYERLQKEYNFIKDSSAYKIALPQDDYWYSENRDQWFVDWNINEVQPVCSKEYWDILYPKCLNAKIKINQGYTGYITPMLRERARSPLPRNRRTFDVVYRAKGTPGHPNRIGILKGKIGERFVDAFSGFNLKLDISTDPQGNLPGDKWLDFVENSKCILGSNSGSSLLLRNREMAERIKKFTYYNPKASFLEIEEACFPGEDGKYLFTAISPRNIEAGLLKTVQLLVAGPYSDILLPWEHYIPLDEHCMNQKEILQIVKRIDLQEEIAERCKERLLNCQDIQIESFVNKINESVACGLNLNHKSSPLDEFWSRKNEYQDFLDKNQQTIEKAIESQRLINEYKRKIRDTLPKTFLQLIRKIKPR